MPGALIVRTWRGKPFTKDILAKGIRQVREKLGIPKELKLGDLRRTAWTEMADGGVPCPSWQRMLDGLWTPLPRTWTPNFVTSEPLADAGHGRREKNIKGTKK